MNPLLETSVDNEAVIDDVIANMSKAFQAAGADESKLQELKQIWRSKLQKRLQVNATEPVPNVDTNSSVDITKKDAKEEQAAPTATAVTDAVLPGNPWVLKELEMPHLLRNPLFRRKNMAVGHPMQLDGNLPPIKEDRIEEELQDDEMAEIEALLKSSSEGESLNSGDDLSGDEDDLFESENVIACQYNKVTRQRYRWKFDLCNGIMHINGKDYVFKHMLGDADWYLPKDNRDGAQD